MTDMLVKLFSLPALTSDPRSLEQSKIEIRCAMVPEKLILVDWVRKEFSDGWAGECDVSFTNKPVSCFVAIKDKKPVGFACYDAMYKGFFGPIGVSNSQRRRGVGKALLLMTLHAMASQGYAYAIIGHVGPEKFFMKTVDAEVIEGTAPDIYRGMLKK